MASHEPRSADRRSTHRALIGALTGLLVAFSVWCVVLLLRTHELRSDLGNHLGWLDDVRQIRGDLERLRVYEPTIPGGEPQAARGEATPVNAPQTITASADPAATGSPRLRLERSRAALEAIPSRQSDPEILGGSAPPPSKP